MLADVQCQYTTIPSSTEHTASLEVDAVSLTNFYVALLLIDAVLRLKKVNGYLRVDAELHHEKHENYTHPH